MRLALPSKAYDRGACQAGLKRAKAEGKVLGRPCVSVAVEAKVIELRGKGEGMRKIARTLGIGNCTVQRIVNA
jgi:DNA invertase Pin-like site-specific DNA recombinase